MQQKPGTRRMKQERIDEKFKSGDPFEPIQDKYPEDIDSMLCEEEVDISTSV